MKNAYIAYYAHLVRLRQVANKQTLFLSHMLTMMTFDKKTKQNVVSLSASLKRRIMSEIGSNSTDVLRAANQYLQRLQKAGLVKSIGGGDYLVDPESYGYPYYVSQALRMKSKAIYCTYEFTDDGVKEERKLITDSSSVDMSSGIIEEDGGYYFVDNDGVRIEV